ncbi:putative ABC transport system ATP-binding protein [Mycoplasma testudineum]|uniref:Putative ABC transport system ATP-binding protein n=1 Tax=Mycoplasma testudineum TaxID=244584 RepID=A0A4R6IDU8_9MOLU|nr:cysteine peptidase family C39 domain-containing protein [Mycoplasma testudineum]OYD26658.1 hypothetical protein CG473_02555 [Mycoplasma testudineum]TDO19787.1 putative ABC transport system ATP-binding protein [Mycoplasma testudineum]
MEIKLQEDVRDCGLSIIESFYQYYYGSEIDVNLLKYQVNYGSQGISVSEIKNLAQKYGIDFESYKVSFEDLLSIKNNEKYVAIINNNGLQHYVIVVHRSSKKIIYLDPFLGKQKVTYNEFSKIFLNVILSVEKGTIKDISHKISTNIFESIGHSKWSLLVFLSIMLGIALTFISSFFMKILFDNIYVLNNLNKLLTIGIIFSWIIVNKLLNDFLKNYLVIKIQNKIEIEISENFFRKILEIEIQDFTKLNYYDYLRRSGLISQIAEFKSKFLFSIVNELFTLTISTIFLFFISYKLFLITVIATLVMFVISISFQHLYLLKYKKVLSDSMLFSTNSNDLIFSKKQALNNNSKKYFLRRWKMSQLASESSQYNFVKMNLSKTFIMNFVTNISPILIGIVGVYLFSNSEITIGNLLMYLSLFNFFSSPFLSFSELITKLPLIKKNIALLNFVHNFKTNGTENNYLEVQKIKKIQFKNFSFGYEKDKEILNIKNLSINSSIRLSGYNGSGKSTLLDIISGHYPRAEFFINDSNFIHLNIEKYRDKIFYIFPNYFFNNASAFEFITFSNPEYIQTLKDNLEKFDLLDMLSNLRLDLKTSLENNAVYLSSGQKQTIILLRLFTRKFDLILLDEAFENIDVENVKKLKSAILSYQNEALFIEISHNKNFVTEGKEIDLEKISKT